MENRNILVLGGCGYLGSKVVKELVLRGDTVVCTKRMSSNLQRLISVEKAIKFIPASVDSVIAALQYTQFDVILNMVSNYGRMDVLYDNVLESNIVFPLTILNAAVEGNIRRFITIGTGLPAQLNMYSFSKDMLNKFGQFYSEKHDIDFSVVKLEMFYGIDEPQDRFIPNLIHNMCCGLDVNTTLGTQKRDIIAVADVVRAITMIIDANLKGYREIPVGTGIAPSISEIVDYIWENTGRRSKINKGAVPMRKNEPDCIADTTILNAMGSWNPIHWEDGIHEMIIDKMHSLSIQ